MKELNQLIINIDNKVKQLVSLMEKDREEIKNLNNRIIELQNTIKEQKLAIIQLEETNKYLKITKSLEKGKDNIDAKLKINEMLREIEKCMGMLNS